MFDVNGIATAVYGAGTGTPIVVLHGAWSLPDHSWALALSARYEVLRPLHPGYGNSDDDPSIDSVHDYRLHYLDLFDQLHLRRFHLVGHSLGGYIAASFALEHSDRLKNLVLASPAGLHVPATPTTDFFGVPPEEVVSRSSICSPTAYPRAGAKRWVPGSAGRRTSRRSLGPAGVSA